MESPSPQEPMAESSKMHDSKTSNQDEKGLDDSIDNWLDEAVSAVSKDEMDADMDTDINDARTSPTALDFMMGAALSPSSKQSDDEESKDFIEEVKVDVNVDEKEEKKKKETNNYDIAGNSDSMMPQDAADDKKFAAHNGNNNSRNDNENHVQEEDGNCAAPEPGKSTSEESIVRDGTKDEGKNTSRPKINDEEEALEHERESKEALEHERESSKGQIAISNEEKGSMESSASTDEKLEAAGNHKDDEELSESASLSKLVQDAPVDQALNHERESGDGPIAISNEEKGSMESSASTDEKEEAAGNHKDDEELSESASLSKLAQDAPVDQALNHERESGDGPLAISNEEKGSMETL
eukprot:scaffold2414_cov178-Chaetoceros_neogracile.AAC.4